MSALPLVEHHDHSEAYLAELEAVADVEQQPWPATAADVHDMTPQQRAEWICATPARDRWEVIGHLDQPAPRRQDRYSDHAACQGSETDLSEITTQDEGQPHALDLCASCPVLSWCAADAREHKAWGLWAGVVLRNGHPAPQNTATQNNSTERLKAVAAWLTAHLTEHGPQLRARLRQAAREHGYGDKALTGAADRLGIDRTPGKPWTLPGQDEPDLAAEQPPTAEQPLALTGRPHRGQRWQPRRKNRRKARR